ncbi:hypothetical protein [Gloeothece verrucosa]|uniref:Uncharacterized protein n=1 Tax=Gloeothece verrucosa (strain PCC 7822) TaxID=497965 RepID=E0UC51_GLOV7|nr:hypothetical protein [Gloeothece verrucosa]ADN16389.1 conserved hypothetical protein [Gloeothece verrucosa PCC 7822]
MKAPPLIKSNPEIPLHRQGEIRQHFPNQAWNELTIRYYDSVEDVGYEYYTQKVLSACHQDESVRYLEPFISFVRLGESLILSEDGCVIYDNEKNDDSCTETGPFWWITAK